MKQIFQTLKLSVDPRGVATLTLDRPGEHNALDYRLIVELREAARLIDGDDSIRVAVITGDGKSFCAGGHIGWFSRNLSLTREQRIEQSGELASMPRKP